MRRISIGEGSMTEALAQIDAMEGPNARQKSCLRLLTEEMYAMVKALLGVDVLDFDMVNEDRKYSLSVSAFARVSEEAREQFLSLSSDGRNAANRGILGMLGAVVDSLLYGDGSGDLNDNWHYGMCSPSGDYSRAWALSQYINVAPPEKAQKDWDGMEKSILANFADDITIAVRSGKLEMTVAKAF